MLNLDLSLERDVKLLISSIGIVCIALGFMQVAQNIYLAMIGIPPVLIGFLQTVGQISSSIRMVFFGILSDRIDRRWVLILMFILKAIFFLIYCFSRTFPLFLLAAVIGAGPVESFGGSIEAALITEKTEASRRTMVFSIQYFVASMSSTVGLFTANLPDMLVERFGIPLVDAIRILFIFHTMVVFVASIPTLLVSKESRTAQSKDERYLSKETKRNIVKLSLVYAVDFFGTGLIYGLFSLWFYLRFGIGIKTVGNIFTVSKIFETITYLLGGPIGMKIGLIKTITLARLGGAISVGLTPFMPNYVLAAVMFTARNTIQHISVPLRMSYSMAIFDKKERATAASLSRIPGTVADSTSNAISGYIMQNFNTTIPPLVSSVFVGIATILNYILFKNIKPPEERNKID